MAALSEALVRQGHQVTVHTRRDDPGLPPVVLTPTGVAVHHVDAGPAGPLPKDDLLPWMGTFASVLEAEWATTRPDVVHAHFWMSGLASLRAARPSVYRSFRPFTLWARSNGAIRAQRTPAR